MWELDMMANWLLNFFTQANAHNFWWSVSGQWFSTDESLCAWLCCEAVMFHGFQNNIFLQNKLMNLTFTKSQAVPMTTWSRPNTRIIWSKNTQKFYKQNVVTTYKISGKCFNWNNSAFKRINKYMHCIAGQDYSDLTNYATTACDPSKCTTTDLGDTVTITSVLRIPG